MHSAIEELKENFGNNETKPPAPAPPRTPMGLSLSAYITEVVQSF